MSIRNLSGAPSFGSTTLDKGGGRKRARSRTADGSEITSSLISRTFSQSLGAGSSGANSSSDNNNNRRRSSLYAVLGNNSGSQHHLSGEVIGTSPSQSFAYRPRYNNNVSNSYNIRDVSLSSLRGSLTGAPPPPLRAIKSSSPTSGHSFRKRLRSATWDSASKLSPTHILSKSNSFQDPSSPTSSASTGYASPSSLTSSLPNRLALDANTKIMYDEDKVIGISDSSSDGDNDYNEEMKCEEVQEMDVSLHFLYEGGESDNKSCSPMRSNDGRNNGKNEDSTTSLTSDVKGVTFSDDIEYNEASNQQRPSYTAKLPALTQWDSFDSDDEQLHSLRSPSVGSPSVGSPSVGSISSPDVGHHLSKKGFSHFRREPAEQSRFAKLNPFTNLSWSLAGSCIVRTAPCFWCIKNLGISPTDRDILLRLNLLCAFFCVIQICIGVFLFVVNYTGYSSNQTAMEIKEDEEEIEGNEEKPLVSAELWSLELFVYCLAVVNIVLLIASMLAQRAIREVNLVGSVRYMWTLFWVTPIQIFFMIGLFDYYAVNEIHTTHWWDDPSMRISREITCPPGTANDECAVPILGGAEYDNEEAWCRGEYNVTKANETYCATIRDEAQANYNVGSRFFYTAAGIWALVLVVLIWVTLCVLQAVITMPIVQRSKESNIPLWLTFPIIGCYSVGYLLLYSETSVTSEFQDVKWIGLAYFLSGGAFTLAALVGYFLQFYTVLNSRQRRIKQGVVVLFIGTIIVTVFAVGTIFVTSLIYSLNIVDFQLESWRQIACFLDSGGSCTGCNDPTVQEENICPEWKEPDVNSVLQTILKQSATLAAIFLVYAGVTLRYGFVLFRHVSRYQIEYV